MILIGYWLAPYTFSCTCYISYSFTQLSRQHVHVRREEKMSKEIQITEGKELLGDHFYAVNFSLDSVVVVSVYLSFSQLVCWFIDFS